MHYATLGKSPRLDAMKAILDDGLWHTSQNLQTMTGSMAVHSDIAEIRANLRHEGKTVVCKYAGMSPEGRKIYRYRIEEEACLTV